MQRPGPVVNCLENFARFSGRAGRREFRAFLRFCLAVWCGLALLSGAGPLLSHSLLPVGIILVVPLAAVSVRRLHDVGAPARMLLLAIVPLAGQAVLYRLLSRPGHPGRNRFGDDPRFFAPMLAG